MTADAPAKSGVAIKVHSGAPGALPYHWLLPLCFFCLGLIYIYAAPHFEASDSIAHVGMIKWIADHDGALPVQSADHAQLYRQQASQPPLYYFMMAAIWTALDTGRFRRVLPPEPLSPSLATQCAWATAIASFIDSPIRPICIRVRR